MSASGRTLQCRVVTWNIHSGVGTDGVYDPARVAEVLAALDADIIGLQELDWRPSSASDPDPLEFLAETLGMTAVAGPNLRDHRGDYGNGLLTRFEVERVRRHPLAHAGREPRGAIDATLVMGDARLRTLVTHLGLRRWERRRQCDTLRRIVNDGPAADAVLLLADLNEWIPFARPGGTLVPDPFPVGTAARTFPSRVPWLRLDQILAGPRPTHFRHEVVRTRRARRASDHLPVLAEVVWDLGAAL